MIKYKEYKVSDPIIGFIPFHWNLIRSKYILREREARSVDGSEDLLSVSQYTGVTRRKDRKKDSDFVLTRALSLTGYKTVDVDNLVVNIMLAWNGSLGVSKYAGITSPAYGVYEINEKAVPKYIDYLIRTDLYKALFKLKSTGVIDSRLRLYTDQLYTISLVLPPKDEQIKIAHYLDYKNYQINKYIRIKKRQIELLKELKQTIINDAVTGKIDVRTGKPYPKYKDSGVDWLGMIPEEWESMRLKNIVRMKSGEGITSNEISEVGDYPVYGGNGIRGYSSRFTHDGEYILIGRQGALCGNIHTTKGKIWASEHALVTLINSNIDIDWLAYVMVNMNLGQYSETAAQPGISVDKIMKLSIPFPDIMVQSIIASSIKNNVKRIDRGIADYEKMITMLTDLQARLISDVVTGKYDIRDIEVPDVPDDEYSEEQEEDTEDMEDANAND